MTRDEFEQWYAEKRGWSVERLRQHRHIVRCGPELGCDYSECQGWAAVSLEDTNHRGLDGLDENFEPLVTAGTDLPL